jgi:hypothetical protein
LSFTAVNPLTAFVTAVVGGLNEKMVKVLGLPD